MEMEKRKKTRKNNGKRREGKKITKIFAKPDEGGEALSKIFFLFWAKIGVGGEYENLLRIFCGLPHTESR